MKKFCVLVLTIAMVLGMSVPSFAANTPTSVRPVGVCAVDGQLVVTDGFNKQVLQGNGRTWTVLAGAVAPAGANGEPVGIYKDGAADAAYFMSPWAIVPFMDGYAVSDPDANVVRYVVNGVVRTLIVAEAGLKHPTGLATDGEKLYVADTANDRIMEMGKDGKVKVLAAGISGPTGLCWADGLLYACETDKNRIVSVTAAGKVEVVAGQAVPDEAEYAGGYVNGLAEKAEFDHPLAVAVSNGVVYVGDTGNLAIRMIRNGRVVTLMDASDIGYQTTEPRGLAVVGSTVYVADYFYPYVVSIDTAEKSFSDVAAGAWYEASVKKAAEYNLINGFTDGTFRPEEAVTRAQFVTMLKNAQLFLDGSTVIGGTANFTDVNGAAWYAKNVGWAQENGFVKGLPGTEQNTFRPDAVMTREEMAQIAYNFIVENDLKLPVVSEQALADFADGAAVNESLATAMNFSVGYGIFAGYTDNTLRPQTAVNRAQAAAILSRLIESAGY